GKVLMLGYRWVAIACLVVALSACRGRVDEVRKPTIDHAVGHSPQQANTEASEASGTANQLSNGAGTSPAPAECLKADSIDSNPRRLVVAGLRGLKSGVFSAPPLFDLPLGKEQLFQPYSFKVESLARYRMGKHFSM